MEIILKSISVQNFKGLNDKTFKFGDPTSYFVGSNGIGKTTIFDAFCWVLFGKNSTGVEKFEVRPLNPDGTKKDYVDIVVELILSIDDKDVSLRKTQKQNWVTKKGEEEKKLGGNINLFEINEIPKSETEFKSFLEQMAEESVLKNVTSSTAFVSLPWKEQRKFLFSLASDVPDKELAESIGGFGEIREMLEDGTIEEIEKREKARLKKYNDKLHDIPVRIDEKRKSIKEVDFEKKEKELEWLNNHLKKVRDRIADTSKAYEAREKERKYFYSLKRKLSDIEEEERGKIAKEINAVKFKAQSIDLEIQSKNKFKSSLLENHNRISAEIEASEKRRENLLKEFHDEAGKEFDESKNFCPTCGKEFEEEIKSSMIETFRESKKEIVEEVQRKGKKQKELIEGLTKELVENTVELAELNDSIADLEAKKEEAKSKVLDASGAEEKDIDFSKNKEHQNIKAEILDYESRVEKEEDTGILVTLRDDEKETIERMGIVNKVLFEKIGISEAKERIKELEEEKQDIAQKKADCQRTLDLIEAFIKTKLSTLEGSINDRFKLVNWKLFESQINGGMKEICECTVEGVPYHGVNGANRVNAGLDIINILSATYGVKAPIFIDNRESVTDIMEMDTQIINLIVKQKEIEGAIDLDELMKEGE
ncbi:AAA family ATPase [Lachnospiraceae bacterium ZAX-1]